MRGAMFVIAAGLLLAGCGGRGAGERAGNAAGAGARGNDARRQALAVNVLADTGRAISLAAPPPDVAVRVSLARVVAAKAGAMDPPLPQADPDPVFPPGAPDSARPAGSVAVAGEARLRPPTLLRPGVLIAPRGLRRAATVELDVRVDAMGLVDDVRWAAGDTASALVRAAEQCAETMEFEPARLAGLPVEVWCRQRFEFTPR